MNNSLVILVAIAIGYAFGWYQFSYSADEQIKSIEQQPVVDLEETKLDDHAGEANAQTLLQQVDSESISKTVDTVSNLETVSYTDLAGLVLSPSIEKVTKIIDAMDPAEVSLALSSITSFDDDQIKQLDNPSTFAKRLLSTALFKDAPSNSQGVVTSVEFGNNINSDNSIVAPTTRFAEDAGRIYASFSLDKPVEQVFIKWFQTSPYKLKLFNKYSINQSLNRNFIWYKPQSWHPGIYTVEVYAIDSQLTKLATGSFFIEE